MTKIEYARVSNKEQSLNRQLKALEGISRVFSDKASGQSVGRPQLQTMFNYIREGDIVVVTELGRLGRDNKELTELTSQVQIREAILRVPNLPSMSGIEDENLKRLINNLMIELCKYQAGLECKQVKERQIQGIETVKKERKFKGRQLKFKEDDPRLQHASDLFLSGLSNKEVEEQTRINHRTLRRYRSRCSVTIDQRKNNKKRDS